MNMLLECVHVKWTDNNGKYHLDKFMSVEYFDRFFKINTTYVHICKDVQKSVADFISHIPLTKVEISVYEGRQIA